MAHARRFVGILMVLGLWLAGCNGPGETGPLLETVWVDGEAFHLEVAADPTATARGLMFRESIPDDGGMLFVFPEASRRWFWMKNCLIDIDLIFLDGRGTVTATHRMVVEPPRGEQETELDYETRLKRYTSGFPARFAIELKSGTLDRLNVKVEDRIELDLPRLKAMAR